MNIEDKTAKELVTAGFHRVYSEQSAIKMCRTENGRTMIYEIQEDLKYGRIFDGKTEFAPAQFR